MKPMPEPSDAYMSIQSGRARWATPIDGLELLERPDARLVVDIRGAVLVEVVHVRIRRADEALVPVHAPQNGDSGRVPVERRVGVLAGEELRHLRVLLPGDRERNGLPN